MKLMVFDLDTALCQTKTMDGLAMAKAIKDVAKISVEPDSFGSLLDLKTVWYHSTSRVATTYELVELRTRFSFHLRRQFLIRPSVVSANYQLVEHVNRLQNQKNVVVGLISAITAPALIMKSRSIGLVSETLPIATGEDSDSLNGILNAMKTRVRRSFGIDFTSAHIVAGQEWKKSAQEAEFEFITTDEFMEGGARQETTSFGELLTSFRTQAQMSW